MAVLNATQLTDLRQQVASDGVAVVYTKPVLNLAALSDSAAIAHSVDVTGYTAPG